MKIHVKAKVKDEVHLSDKERLSLPLFLRECTHGVTLGGPLVPMSPYCILSIITKAIKLGG